MKTIAWNGAGVDGALVGEIVQVLEAGGVVCMACGGRYRLVADLQREEAVIELMQSKRRVKQAPALVFVDDQAMLPRFAAALEPLAQKLAVAFWPEALTLRVAPHPELPEKVLKQLGGKKARIGVRVPRDALVREVVRRFGKPLLASSANLEKKTGDSSPAQVKKNFGSRLQLFVDQGDLKPEPVSTVVDVQEGRVVVTRVGAIAAERVEAAIAE